jgi:hypothetical protein
MNSAKGKAGETLIVEVTMPPQQMVFFQSLLQGEDGLAVARSFDPDKLRLQLWTSEAQEAELMCWLADLPPSIGLEKLGSRIWYKGEAEAV